MTEQEIYEKLIPESIKRASSRDIARVLTGLEEFTLDKIAAYLGEKIAQRHNKWRPVASGLLALHKLGFDTDKAMKSLSRGALLGATSLIGSSGASGSAGATGGGGAAAAKATGAAGRGVANQALYQAAKRGK